MADILPWRKPSNSQRERRTAAYLSDFILVEGVRELRRQHRAALSALRPSRAVTFYIDSGLAEAAQIGTAMKRLLIDAENDEVNYLVVERVARLAPSLTGVVWVLNRLLRSNVEVIEAIGGRATLDDRLRDMIDDWVP